MKKKRLTKILILSYYFPPCNLTAANRSGAWAQYFSDNGIYPIIITRNWDRNIKSVDDIAMSSGSTVKHIKKNNYEAYYLPYKTSFQEKLFLKRNKLLFRLMSKIITLINGVLQSFNFYNNYLSNFYAYARLVMSKEAAVDKILITGNPFILFKYGMLLSKEFNVKWVADYRDMWNTQELFNKDRKNIFFRLLGFFEFRSEKKWLKSCAHITSVSSYLTEKISTFTNVSGSTVPNGFSASDLQQFLERKLFPDLTICYTGTLYDEQRIDLFINGFKRIIDVNPSVKIKLIFLGAAFQENQKTRILEEVQGYENYVEILDRMPHKAALKLQSKCHILLNFSYGNFKGIPSSKLYEYIGLRKPILICPGDDDIIDSTIKTNELGVVLNSEEEVFNVLSLALLNHKKGLEHVIAYSGKNIDKFSRENSTKEMAKVILDC